MKRSLLICLALTLMNGCLRRGDDLSNIRSHQDPTCDQVGGSECEASSNTNLSNLDLELDDVDVDVGFDVGVNLGIDVGVVRDDTPQDDLGEEDQGVDCPDPTGCASDAAINEEPDMVSSPACTPHLSTVCFNNDVYWVNSCGDREEMSVACDDHRTCVDDGEPRCVCVPEVSSACVGDSIYWYDACGERGAIRERCQGGQTCFEDECTGRVSGSGTCQDPLRMIGSSSITLSSCDSDDTLSFCGSEGVNEVAVLIIADTRCVAEVRASEASFHATAGQCAESSSCISGVEFFSRSVLGQEMIIIEPQSCGTINVNVACE